MEKLLGLLKVRVVRGIDLVAMDTLSSDPYVVLRCGRQKLKTSVKKGSLNPVWNEELTLSVQEPITPIKLEVYDKDTFTKDDKMGEAEIDIQPILYAVKLGYLNVPNGTAIRRVQPSSDNSLAAESSVLWNDGKIVQDMTIKLKGVQHGELELQLHWVELPGAKSL